jgi:hypothetical protein
MYETTRLKYLVCDATVGIRKCRISRGASGYSKSVKQEVDDVILVPHSEA